MHLVHQSSDNLLSSGSGSGSGSSGCRMHISILKLSYVCIPFYVLCTAPYVCMSRMARGPDRLSLEIDSIRRAGSGRKINGQAIVIRGYIQSSEFSNRQVSQTGTF